MHHWILLAVIVVILVYLKRFCFTYEASPHSKYATIKAFQKLAHFPKDLRVFCLQTQLFYYLKNSTEPYCFLYFHTKENLCVHRKPMIQFLYTHGSVLLCEYKSNKVRPQQMYDLAISMGHSPDSIVLVGETNACDYACELIRRPHHALILINPSKTYEISTKTLIFHKPTYACNQQATYLMIQGNTSTIIMPDHYIYQTREFLIN